MTVEFQDDLTYRSSGPKRQNAGMKQPYRRLSSWTFLYVADTASRRLFCRIQGALELVRHGGVTV
jgi:hypothetical protein